MPERFCAGTASKTSDFGLQFKFVALRYKFTIRTVKRIKIIIFNVKKITYIVSGYIVKNITFLEAK